MDITGNMYNQAFINRGDKAQRDFVAAYLQQYPRCCARITEAFGKDDLNHIDVWVTGNSEIKSFDVKAIKNYVRDETKYQVVELFNDKFYEGWLFSASTDYIAFQSGTTDTDCIFLCVLRTELRKHCKANTRLDVMVGDKSQALNKLYSRKGRDIITLVDMTYLEHLEGSFKIYPKHEKTVLD